MNHFYKNLWPYVSFIWYCPSSGDELILSRLITISPSRSIEYIRCILDYDLTSTMKCWRQNVTVHGKCIQMFLFGIKFRFCSLYSYESTLMNRHRKFLFSKSELLLSINPLFQHNQEMHSFDVCMTRSLKFTFSYKIFIDLKSIFYTGAKRHFLKIA